MAWETAEKSIPLVRPIYYYYPENEKAYNCKNQYYFGSQLISAPFTSPRDKDTNLNRQLVWLPEGEWFDFFTGEYYAGEKTIAVYGDLNEVPLFGKSGAIVPLDGRPEFGKTSSPEVMDIYVFPGADNEFTLYEDDGKTTAYKMGKYFTTRFVQKWYNNRLDLEVCSDGDESCTSKGRNYNIVVRGVVKPENIKLIINGEEKSIDYSYEQNKDTLIIKCIKVLPSDRVNLSIDSSLGLLSRRNRADEKLERLIRIFTMESQIKKVLHDILITDNAGFEEFIYKIGMDYTNHITQNQITALIETKTGKELLSSINTY
jgi:hypothetical protein